MLRTVISDSQSFNNSAVVKKKKKRAAAVWLSRDLCHAIKFSRLQTKLPASYWEKSRAHIHLYIKSSACLDIYYVIFIIYTYLQGRRNSGGQGLPTDFGRLVDNMSTILLLATTSQTFLWPWPAYQTFEGEMNKMAWNIFIL